MERLDIVILGLSVTSSWGNGHATTYRALIQGLAARGHRILFLERDVPWYAGNRDQPSPPGARVALYHSVAELVERFEGEVSRADLVIVGSFVPDGIEVARWVQSVSKGVTAFYDIDTPVTLGKLDAGECDYLSPELASRFGMYLSFTGGPTLERIERRYGSPMARVLYCSVDPAQYHPQPSPIRWDLGYLGTYSADRQPSLERLMLLPALRLAKSSFVVAGPMYPEDIAWPDNVARMIHLEPKLHSGFYAAQRFTLNITRAGMIAAGYSPSVRLFEAGACGAAIISDVWRGIEELFTPGREILLAESEEDVLRYLTDVPDEERRAMGERAMSRILAEHTPARRAAQIETYYREVRKRHDGFSAHSTRRNGSGRKVPYGLAARSRIESSRGGAGEEVGGAAGDGAAARRLQQSPGAGDANGGGSRAPSRIGGPSIGSRR